MAEAYQRRHHEQMQPRLKPKSLVTLIVLLGAAVLLFNKLPSKTSVASRAVVTAAHYTHSQTICLDPGHGGDDPGASSEDGTILERDINLTVAQDVQGLLNKAGYQVFMTRTTNAPTLSNHDRYSFCNAKHATILVSIHHNYFTDDTVDYDTALFYKDQDQALAYDILNATAAKLNITNDGISQFDDGVLSESNMPAALSEGFFITSYAEYLQLTQSGSTRLADEAQGIATGIINYFTQPKNDQPPINTNPQVINRTD